MRNQTGEDARKERDMEPNWLTDEAEGWQRIQELREVFSAKMFENVRAGSRTDVFVFGMHATLQIFAALKNAKVDVTQIQPGHGLGHLVRDYVNALRLFSKLEASPKQLFVALIGGIFHDIGCAVVDRRVESKKAVRHAEAGALLLLDLFAADSCGMNSDEQLLVAYTVAAHTHCLKTQTVVCGDGESREVVPYKDLDDDGKPILGVWGTRWTDRLDTNGPAYLGRHYMTLVEDHEDFQEEGYFVLKYKEHMRPILRDKPEGARTMLEHMQMFANSQATKPPYGLHDFGTMVELRDAYRVMLENVIAAVLSDELFVVRNEDKIWLAWERFLGSNVEPTEKGRLVAAKLGKMFVELDDDSKQKWMRGFYACMKNYIRWANDAVNFLGMLPRDWHDNSALPCDIVSAIAPSYLWRGLIDTRS
ncbi:hypothetical protein HY932_01305 [Candidatus Falkowbacteria bacterium]|nr:hypothetical protein [Candidatus Falkowbacteria bacterium]